MLQEGETPDDCGPKELEDDSLPLNSNPTPLGSCCFPVCSLEPDAPESDATCWALKEASNGMSTPVCSFEGVLEGESPAEPGAVDDGTDV